MNKNGGSSPLSALQGATLNPNCELKDPDLCKFINNWKALSNFTVSTTTKDKSGETSESVFELAGEAKSHIRASQNGKDVMDMIIIDDTTYTKDFSDGKWWKYTYKEGENEEIKDLTKKDEFNDVPTGEDKTQYKAMGKEPCGDMNCFKYQVIDPEDPDTIQYIWFDDKEYKLRKQTITTKDGETTEATFSYNTVTVNAPSPVKEGTPEQMYGGVSMLQMSAEDKAEFEQMKKEAEKQMQSMPQEYQAPM